jgi:hypothetical protein
VLRAAKLLKERKVSVCHGEKPSDSRLDCFGLGDPAGLSIQFREVRRETQLPESQWSDRRRKLPGVVDTAFECFDGV